MNTFLFELLCGNGYETWTTTEENEFMKKLPIHRKELTERGHKVAEDLFRKNMIKVNKDGIIKSAYKLESIMKYFYGGNIDI